MPLKPPTPQTTAKKACFLIFCCCLWGGRFFGAWQPCMLANTHVDSPQEPIQVFFTVVAHEQATIHGYAITLQNEVHSCAVCTLFQWFIHVEAVDG